MFKSANLTDLTNLKVFSTVLIMLNNSVSIDEFRSNLAELIGKVMYGNNRIIIKKYNREAAVVLSVEEYEKLLDPTKRLSPTRWKNKFKTIDKIKASMPDIDPAIIKDEVAKAVKAVRAEKRAQFKNA